MGLGSNAEGRWSGKASLKRRLLKLTSQRKQGPHLIVQAQSLEVANVPPTSLGHVYKWPTVGPRNINRASAICSCFL